MLSGSDLLDLADAVSRLTVSRHDPERFFIDRSEIAHRLRMAARERVPVMDDASAVICPRRFKRIVKSGEGSHDPS